MEGNTSTLITTLGTNVTQAWSWLGDLLGNTTLVPVLMIPVAFGVARATIGLFRSATRLGGRRR